MNVPKNSINIKTLSFKVKLKVNSLSLNLVSPRYKPVNEVNKIIKEFVAGTTNDKSIKL